MDGNATAARDLGQEAYGRIRAAIREGSLAPGERLTETDLARAWCEGPVQREASGA